MAIEYAILSFQQAVRGRHVLIFTDNTTTMAFINQQGGMVSWKLCHIMIDLWDIYLQMGTESQQNPSRGSSMSRQTSSAEEHPGTMSGSWIHVLGSCLWGMGETRNRHLYHMMQFEMWFILHKGSTDSASMGDCLLHSRTNRFLYIFPPILLKLQQDRLWVILITPWWLRKV